MTSINTTKFYKNSLECLNEFEKPEVHNCKSVFISQEKNFANKHGFHYRSSAQFYFEINKEREIKTSLILFNYFKIKIKIRLLFVSL